MATTFHDGSFKLTNYQVAIYRDESGFISQWRLDDISSGSGLDSQHLNHLIASGGPTQTAGWYLASGVSFDGIDDAFYITIPNSSGLEPLKASFPIDPSVAYSHTIFGFFANLKINGFTQEQTIFSRWNGTSVNRLFQVNISQSSGVILRVKSKGSATTSVYYTQDNLIPSGAWFNFGFMWAGRAGNPVFYTLVNDKIFTHSVAGAGFEDSATDGAFALGASDVINSPSGFLNGDMENAYFFNGKAFDLQEYNYLSSGNAPTSIRPSINYFHPHLKALWHLGTLSSGFQGIQSKYYQQEEKFSNHLLASGVGSGVLKDISFPGASDGTRGSGQGFTGQDSPTLVVDLKNIAQNTLNPNGSFTLMFWARPRNAANLFNSTTGYIGSRAIDGLGAFSFNTLNNTPQFNIGYDGGTSATRSTSVRLIEHSWSHIALVSDVSKASTMIYISGQQMSAANYSNIRSGLYPMQVFSSLPYFRIGGTNETSVDSFSGIIDEVMFFRQALTSGEINTFYLSQSGFLNNATTVSGLGGGWNKGIFAIDVSGEAGGWIRCLPSFSGSIGGWISGIPHFESGLVGGWIRGVPTVSGGIGGFITTRLTASGLVGGYLHGKVIDSGLIGGWVAAVEPLPIDATFYAYFNVIGRDAKEFDAQVAIYKSLSSMFDAKVTVYTIEKAPTCAIILPTIHQSGTTTPITYNFEATASGYNNKRIIYTQWMFSDLPTTSGSIKTSSGTFTTSHTFSRSGLFDVIFTAIDDKGLVSSDRIMINTASGSSIPQIQLTATVSSGIAPLAVGFSGIITSAPNPIRQSFIYFGDNTYSVCTNNINKLYIAPGVYTAIFRVEDASGLIATDSLQIGVNN